MKKDILKDILLYEQHAAIYCVHTQVRYNWPFFGHTHTISDRMMSDEHH